MPPRRWWPKSSTPSSGSSIVPGDGRRPLGHHDDGGVATVRRDGARSRSHTSSMSNGSSGTRIMVAPPAMPGPDRDVADVAAHDLDHASPGRGTRRWCGAGRWPRCRSAPRCRSRRSSRWRPMSLSIVLGTPMHGDAVVVQVAGGAQAPVAADDDEAVEPVPGHGRPDHLDPAVDRRRAGARQVPRIGAAPGQDAPAAVDRRAARSGPPSRPRQPSRKPMHGAAVVALDLAHDGPDHRVEARAVTAAGQDPDSHWSAPCRRTGSTSTPVRRGRCRRCRHRPSHVGSRRRPWPSSSPSTPAPPGSGPSPSTRPAGPSASATGSSPSTSPDRGGSSTTRPRSGHAIVAVTTPS